LIRYIFIIMSRLGISVLLSYQLSKFNKPCYLISKRFVFRVCNANRQLISIRPMVIHRNPQTVIYQHTDFWFVIKPLDQDNYGTKLNIHNKNGYKLINWSTLGYSNYGNNNLAKTLYAMFGHIDCYQPVFTNAFTMIKRLNLQLSMYPDVQTWGSQTT
jgi:hypothetical protein